MPELTWEYLFKEGVEDLSKELNLSERECLYNHEDELISKISNFLYNEIKVNELKKLMKEDYSSNLGIKDFECIISLELFKYIQSIMLNMRTIK
jgi:hypothetical protein